VVGGGNSAGEESIFLTKFASKVMIAVRGERMKASQVVRESVESDPKIEVLTGVTVEELRGDGRLRSVVLRDIRTGKLREIAPAGVFVFVGLTPNTDFVRDRIATDERGFILTDAGLQTNVPGVFAAGDCRAGSTNQAASAAGEGAAAALAIRRYLEPLASGLPRRATAASESEAPLTPTAA
jgi:thioredoxin reductase (NADPH)